MQLEEVLYHKFVQHPHLRGMLMRTGYAPLVYQEPDASLVDASVNALGRALVRVRERLREEELDT